MKPLVAHLFGSALGGTLCLLALAGNAGAADKPKAPASTNAAAAVVTAPVEEKTIILVKAFFENPSPANKLIDPFFPGSQRPAYKPLEPVVPVAKGPENPGKPAEVDCYEGIALKGVSSFAGGRLLAIINDKSMEEGESANVKTHRGMIRIKVLKITSTSANIQAIEIKQGNESVNLEKQCNPKVIDLPNR